jgi:hypothetical protein
MKSALYIQISFYLAVEQGRILKDEQSFENENNVANQFSSLTPGARRG